MRIEDEIKQKNFESPLHKAIINLFFTSSWLRDRQSEVFKPFDLLPQHYNVLRILRGKYPEVCSAGEIKEVMLDKGPDVTRLVDKLYHVGLVDRKQCEENRRKVDIRITAQGLELLLQIDLEMKRLHQSISQGIGPEECLLLSDLLDRLRA